MSQLTHRVDAVPLRRVAGAVFWSFFGVRKNTDRERDMAQITPLQAIAGGVIGAALFVSTLLTVVHFVTR